MPRIKASGLCTVPSFQASKHDGNPADFVHLHTRWLDRLMLQASGWFKHALFKDAPAWQSTFILYAFRAGRSKQLRYQVCFLPLLCTTQRMHL